MSAVTRSDHSFTLLDEAIDAVGGLEAWRTHSFLSAHLTQGGDLWPMKGQAGVLDDVRIDVALHQEWVSHHPFGSPELRSSFTPRRVELRNRDGITVEALDDPRPSFTGPAFETPWTRLQLAYFAALNYRGVLARVLSREDAELYRTPDHRRRSRRVQSSDEGDDSV